MNIENMIPLICGGTPEFSLTTTQGEINFPTKRAQRMKGLLSALLLVASAVFFIGCQSETPPKPETMELPDISLDGTVLTGEQKVIITSTTGGASIYYTTDDSNPADPNGSRILYNTPFASGSGALAEMVTVRAIAVKKGYINSGEVTKTFTKQRVLSTVIVEKGSFSMGTPKPEGDSDERPQHTVELTKNFYLGETEVTQGQYKAVMKIGNTEFINPSDNQMNDDLPVEMVTWYDAIAFCNALSLAEGFPAYYTIMPNSSGSSNPPIITIADTTDITADSGIGSGIGYRLATEAEWEYAAGGGNGTRTKYAGTNDESTLAEYAVYNDSLTTVNVKSKEPNALGLYDMSGNVREWCWDIEGDYTESTIKDPTGSSENSKRIHRGGAFEESYYLARIASRSYSSPTDSTYLLGFRVVRSQ